MVSGWDYTELDRKISEELQGFLPERIFDCLLYTSDAADE